MPESVWDWSKTAADNNDADAAINWSEGQAPGSVNNSARAMMAAAAKLRDDQGGALTLAGSVNAYTLATNSGIAELADGMRLHLVPNLTNTGAATLNVDSRGAEPLRKFTGLGETALTAGALVKDGHYIVQWDASADATGGAWIVLNPTPEPPAGLLYGLELSRNAGTPNSQIDISAGRCADDTNAVLLVSPGVLTVNFATTGANGLDTGSLANGTWYHLFLIGHTDGTIAGFGSTSLSPTLPSGYAWKRRLGSVKTSGAAQFLAFTQSGDEFRLATEITERSATTLSATWAQLTLAGVPSGLRVSPFISGFCLQNAAGIVATELADGDQASTPTSVLYLGRTAFASDEVYFNSRNLLTDTSARIRFRVYSASGSPSLTSHQSDCRAGLTPEAVTDDRRRFYGERNFPKLEWLSFTGPCSTRKSAACDTWAR